MLDILQTIANETSKLNKAMSEFSLSKFYSVHLGNVEAYKEENIHAEKYYNEIMTYFADICTMHNQYLSQQIKK